MEGLPTVPLNYDQDTLVHDAPEGAYSGPRLGKPEFLTISVAGIVKLPLGEAVARVGQEVEALQCRALQLRRLVCERLDQPLYAESEEWEPAVMWFDSALQNCHELKRKSLLEAPVENKATVAKTNAYIADFYELRRVWFLLQTRLWLGHVREEEAREEADLAAGRPTAPHSAMRQHYEHYSHTIYAMMKEAEVFEFALMAVLPPH